MQLGRSSKSLQMKNWLPDSWAVSHGATSGMSVSARLQVSKRSTRGAAQAVEALKVFGFRSTASRTSHLAPQPRMNFLSLTRNGTRNHKSAKGGRRNNVNYACTHIYIHILHSDYSDSATLSLVLEACWWKWASQAGTRVTLSRCAQHGQSS